MDFQPQAMSGTVEKPLHPTTAPACLVALVGKEIQNILMHLAARDFIPQLIKSQLLSPLYRMVKLTHRSIRPSFDHRAGDVAKITGPLRSGKNIENNRLVGSQQSTALLVRITPLFPPGHNRVRGQSAGLENGGIDNAAQFV